MFVTPAYAQDAVGASGGMADVFIQLMPIALLVVIFWLLIFRPVVTTGGIVGKVTKAVDGEDLEVEIATGVKVKLVRGMVADVRSKSEPVNDNKPA
jgi:preprotein translocase subunit YajC